MTTMATAMPAVGGRSRRVIRLGRRGLQHAAAATGGGRVAAVSCRSGRRRHHRRLPCHPPLPSQLVAGHATAAPADRRGGSVVRPLRRRRPCGRRRPRRRQRPSRCPRGQCCRGAPAPRPTACVLHRYSARRHGHARSRKPWRRPLTGRRRQRRRWGGNGKGGCRAGAPAAAKAAAQRLRGYPSVGETP